MPKGLAGSRDERLAGNIRLLPVNKINVSVLKTRGFLTWGLFYSFWLNQDIHVHNSALSPSVPLQILVAWERHKLPASDLGIYAANLISV